MTSPTNPEPSDVARVTARLMGYLDSPVQRLELLHGMARRHRLTVTRLLDLIDAMEVSHD